MKFTIAGHLDLLNVVVRFDGGAPLPVRFDLDQYGIYLFVPNGPAGKHKAEISIKNKPAFTFRTEMRKGYKKNSRK